MFCSGNNNSQVKTSGAKPKLPAKDVVLTLMGKVRKEVRDLKSAKGKVTRRNATFVVHKCPKGDTCLQKVELRFKKARGFTNPLRNLRSCLCSIDDVDLQKLC